MGGSAERAVVQGSLLELLDGDVTSPAPGPLSPERAWLARGAWVDVHRGWLAGSQELYDRLAAKVPWRAERRQMYDRAVDVPRLQCFYPEDADLPDPALDTAREALSRHYADELGEPFRTAGLCLYRDGRDSVAWHGDTIGRGSSEDTIVAIVSLGTARPLLLRPRAGLGARPGTGMAQALAGRPAGSPATTAGTLRYRLGHGDLLVMGGSCQRTWEHAIPKSAGCAGPRISVQFRPRGVR
jgi:alkylated DNA repair dioxygenase AlkB